MKPYLRLYCSFPLTSIHIRTLPIPDPQRCGVLTHIVDPPHPWAFYPNQPSNASSRRNNFSPRTTIPSKPRFVSYRPACPSPCSPPKIHPSLLISVDASIEAEGYGFTEERLSFIESFPPQPSIRGSTNVGGTLQNFGLEPPPGHGGQHSRCAASYSGTVVG